MAVPSLVTAVVGETDRGVCGNGVHGVNESDITIGAVVGVTGVLET